MRLPPVGSTFNDRYRLDEILGEGGFSTVYAATDQAARRPVAIKILKPDKNGYLDEVSSRFRREVRIVANLSDPHTVTMFDSGTSSEGLLFMVFEHVPGQDLSQLIASRGAISEADAIHILTQVLQSLREAHRAGLLHRDIKPENIRIYEYGGDSLRAKLLDFGIARPTTAEASRITRPGELVGTPRYMSPEQLLEKELTPASDLYSLGLVTLELLLGRALLHGNSWSDQVQRLKEGHVFELPGSHNISPLLRQIVLRMCAREPGDRYANAEMVLRDLGYQLSSDSLRQSALNDLVERAPTAPRLDVSSDAFPRTPTPSDIQSASSLEIATTRKRRKRKKRPSHERTQEEPKAPPVGVNPLHALIALLFGAIVALGAVLLVIWPKDAPPPPPPPVRDVPFVKIGGPTPPKAMPVAPAIVADAETSPDLGSDAGPLTVPHATLGCGTNDRRRGLVQIHAVQGLSKATHAAYIPRDYDPNEPHPVIFLFHDAGQDPQHNIEFAGFSDIADTNGVVLLAPQGEEIFDGTGLWLRVWEGDSALVPAFALWNAAAEQLCLDRRRVFAVGHAAGGYAAHKLACEFPLAGLVMNGHVKVVTDRVCEPDPPVPTMILIGRADGYAPREGGVNCAGSNKLSWKEVDDRWKKFNGCRGGPKTFIKRDDGQCMKWTCDTAYARCDLDGGREWPGTRPMIWDRFNQNCGGYPGSFPSVPQIWEFFAAAPAREVPP